MAPVVPPTAPAPGSDAAGSPASFPTRDQLVQAWGDNIIGRLRPKAKALYQAGRFIGAGGGRAEFGLPNEIHRTRCEELRPEVEGVLSDYFGCPVGLDLVLDPAADTGPAAPGWEVGLPGARRARRSAIGRPGAVGPPAPPAAKVVPPVLPRILAPSRTPRAPTTG